MPKIPIPIDIRFEERKLINAYEYEERHLNLIHRNFRKIPICLTFDEIHYNIEPNLRRNIINGHYTCADHYLDIHFILLREDLNRSLRRGINAYIEAINSGEIPEKLKDIRVYESVRIGERCPKSLTAFWAQFDVRKLGLIDWKYSKRLLYGSLLCLSANNFETFCFASVTGDRKEDNLSNGLIQLEFETEGLTDEFRHFDPNTTFVMIESEVYFEAYKHNLMALKRFRDNNFPFKQYIIELSKDESIRCPVYMKGNTYYDILVPNTDSLKRVRLMISNEWPNAEEMTFDDSQYLAFKTALLNRFVLIQGPPGTGKTYVGLKIVETLLLNCDVWTNYGSNDSTRPKPIVIICYTNHALDQFLEGMLPFCRNLVRIGGQSKSELLEEYTLKSIRESMKGKKYFPNGLDIRISKCYGEMKNIHSDITKIDSKINNCRTDLLRLEQLYELEPGDWFDQQMVSLLKNYWNDFDLALILWITNCDHKVVNKQKNKLKQDSNDLRAVGNQFGDNYLNYEMDEQEVNRIIENRFIDKELEYDLNASNVEVFNTIFKTKPKSLELISQRVIKQLRNEMITQLASNDVMDSEEAESIKDVTQLEFSSRWRLYRHWINVYTDHQKKIFKKLNTDFDLIVRNLKNLHLEKDMHLIRSRGIVGMTTTGAAKFRNIIEKIDPKIVVIEEAAEVLESHLICSLTRSTEHLIQIGDHKQLRAEPAVYELKQKYKLDVSLFERMIINKMPFIQLKLQHRMRPEISKLLVPHIYKQLEDHESVRHYEDIRGIRKNMFFISHSEPESTNDDNMSKSNRFEAEFLVRLAKHLIFQDYDCSQITILSLYSSQLILIKRLLQSDPDLKTIQAFNVDNFQGEENDIILVSFVRSNRKNDIGFLRISNRVNVALSRAKSGLYCVGNFDCLLNSSKLWTNITNYLRTIDAIGPALALRCPNHSRQNITVSNASDFDDKSRLGGCGQPYNHLLECGHNCPLNVCHVSHQQIKCNEECLNKLNCEHICPLICHFPEECNPCAVLMDKIVPKCGHCIEEICSGNSFCYHPCAEELKCGHRCDRKCGEECQTECKVMLEKTAEECGHRIICKCCESPICNLRCGRALSCGHECELKCSDVCDSNRCLASVLKIFEECGHEVQTQCSQDINFIECQSEIPVRLNCGHNLSILCHESKNFINSSEYCVDNCGQLLVCGHQCNGSCIECNTSRLHIKCKQKCTKKLICGHNCGAICGDNCPPCDQICSNRCGHEVCRHTCSQPCIRCPKPCLWKCKHKKCTKRCYECCDRTVCEKSCELSLKCGHRCVGLCGQKCPKFCLICNKSLIKNLIGIEYMSEFEINGLKFVELDNCGHIIELNCLQNLLTSIGANNLVFKSCPKCQTIITRSQVFNGLIRKQFSQLVDMNRIYFCYNEDNRPEQQRMVRLIEQFPKKRFNDIINPYLTRILDDLKRETRLSRKLYIRSKYQLSVIENKVNILKILMDVLCEMEVIDEIIAFTRRSVWKSFQLNRFPKYFQRLNTFLNFISEQFSNTCQQIRDLEQELRFFVLFSKLLFKVLTTNLNVNQCLEQLVVTFDEFLNTGSFTQDIENDFQSKVMTIIGENNESIDISVKLNESFLPNVLNE